MGQWVSGSGRSCRECQLPVSTVSVSGVKTKSTKRTQRMKTRCMETLPLPVGPKFEGIRLNPTFEMFLQNEAKLCRPYRAQIYVGGCLTQDVAGLCPGLSYYRPFRTRRGRMQKITKRSHRLRRSSKFRVRGSKLPEANPKLQTRNSKRRQRNYETKPFASRRVKVSGSKFKVLEIYQTKPFGPLPLSPHRGYPFRIRKIRLDPTFQMFLRNEAKLETRYPRARNTMRKLRNEPI